LRSRNRRKVLVGQAFVEEAELLADVLGAAESLDVDVGAIRID